MIKLAVKACNAAETPFIVVYEKAAASGHAAYNRESAARSFA